MVCQFASSYLVPRQVGWKRSLCIFASASLIVGYIFLVQFPNHDVACGNCGANVNVGVQHVVDWAFYNQTMLTSSCSYDGTEVDLRIIVLAFNRAAALQVLLASLQRLQLDGASASLEIWVDRNKTDHYDDNTLFVASNFSWSLGKSRVHLWHQHVGIYGQWIDTWCPRANTNEMALLLEEDLIVSPHVWHWLKAARDAFQSRNDVAGYSLQSEGVFSSRMHRRPLMLSTRQTAFAYHLIGTWGFAPHPRRWVEFRSWFHNIKSTKGGKIANFKPYVDGLIMTDWYKQFERIGVEDTMWSMWFIYFVNENRLYTIYNNLNSFIGKGHHYLSVHNDAFGGMHFLPLENEEKRQKKSRALERKLLEHWLPDYAIFPSDMRKFEFDGKHSPF